MDVSASDKLVLERIENDFTYHAPKGNQPNRYEVLRAAGKSLAKLIVKNCPEGRERSVALTKIEESIMWANAAIARGESGDG